MANQSRKIQRNIESTMQTSTEKLYKEAFTKGFIHGIEQGILSVIELIHEVRNESFKAEPIIKEFMDSLFIEMEEKSKKMKGGEK